MKSHNNFNPNYYQVMANNSGAIGIDTNQKLLCIINENKLPFYLNRENILNNKMPWFDAELYSLSGKQAQQNHQLRILRVKWSTN